MADPPAPTPRADPVTSQGFTLPTVGLDRDTWGDLLNGNWSRADLLIGQLFTGNDTTYNLLQQLIDHVRTYLEPVGSVKMWASEAVPWGWLRCDGNALLRADFPDLFGLIGTVWGAGDGSTTFNLPDLRGCVPVHYGVWMPFANKLGETAHTLSGFEMPQHTHGAAADWAGDHAHWVNAVRLAGGANLASGFEVAHAEIGSQTDVAGNHTHNINVGGAGGNGAHNNIQPSVGLNIIIKCLQVGI